MKLFDATLVRLERSLDVRLVRHNVLAANVANVDTPGYRGKDVDFKAAMASAPRGEGTGTITPGAFAGAGLRDGDIPLTEGAASAASIDGNGVDLDRTMVALAENGLQYGASARAAGKKLAILRYVVSDGNG